MTTFLSNAPVDRKKLSVGAIKSTGKSACATRFCLQSTGKSPTTPNLFIFHSYVQFRSLNARKQGLSGYFLIFGGCEMAETQRDKRIRALALYASLERALYSLDELLDNQCASYGLSRSQYRVLEHLFLYGAMATGRLAGRVLFGESTISVVTKNLAKVGLLVRRGDDADGRKAIVHLTEVGKSLLGRFCRSARSCCGQRCAS